MIKRTLKTTAIAGALLLTYNHEPTFKQQENYEQKLERQTKHTREKLSNALNDIQKIHNEDSKLHVEIRVQFMHDVEEHYTIKTNSDRPKLEFTYPFTYLAGKLLKYRTGIEREGIEKYNPKGWPYQLFPIVNTQLKPLHPEVNVVGQKLRDNTPLSALGDLLVRGYRAKTGQKLVNEYEAKNNKEINNDDNAAKAYSDTLDKFATNRITTSPDEPSFAGIIKVNNNYMICVLMQREGKGKTADITDKDKEKLTKMKTAIEKALETEQ